MLNPERDLPAHHLPGELCLERLRFALGSEASLRNLPPVVPQRSPSALCEAMLGEGSEGSEGSEGLEKETLGSCHPNDMPC